MVNMENYEELMLLAADGELGDEELAQLQEFIKQHPELENEWKLYMATRLQPDETLVYTAKETLLKKETKTITFGKWWMYAAAACLAILIAIPLLRTGEEIKPADEIVQTKTTISEPPIKTEPASPENKPGPTETSEAVAKTGLATQLPRVKKPVTAQPVKAIQQVQPTPPQSEPMVAEVTPKPVAEPQSPPAQPSVVAVVEEPVHVKPATPRTHQDAEKEMFAWMPVDEHKKKGLNDLSVAITDKVEKVKEIKNKIRNADVSFKIGRSELFTVKF